MSALPAFSNVRAICFDLDDTLCGYWAAARAGLRKTFETHRIPGYTPDQVLQAWLDAFTSFYPELKPGGWYPAYLISGEPTRTEQMRRTLSLLLVEDDSLARLLSDTYGRERNAALELFPEALDVLESLGTRFRLGVITNGPADVQRQEIEALGIGHFFEHVFIEGEVGEGKPHVAAFRMAEKAFGLSPDEFLMVGNSFKHDIAGAQKAGWHTAWLRKDTDLGLIRTEATLEQLPEGAQAPDIEMSDLRELLKAL